MKGFVSYAHEDHTVYRHLRVHFKPVERALGLELWADQRLRTGDYWNDRIKQAIDEACFHILIVSPLFLASDYIFDHELPAIKAKYLRGDLVMPVIAQRCCWQPFINTLQAAPIAPPHGRLTPIREWRPMDDGYDAAREQMMVAIGRHFDVKPMNGLF